MSNTELKRLTLYTHALMHTYTHALSIFIFRQAGEYFEISAMSEGEAECINYLEEVTRCFLC